MERCPGAAADVAGLVRLGRPLALLTAALVLMSGCRQRAPTALGACVEPDTRPAEIVVAGSGATVPLAHALVARYREEFPDVDIFVAESIGTGGALRAIGDGAIEVGLASRPVDGPGLSVREVASATLRFGASPDVDVQTVDLTFLAEAARGGARWPDGTPVVFIHREPGDSGVAAIARLSPDLGAAMTEGRGSSAVVAYTDADALHQLATIPGALGIYDPVAAALIGAEVAPLDVSGAPEWSRTLSMFWATDDQTVAGFGAFLRTESARAVVRSLGYRDGG